jgi:hypothetical protein
LVHQLFQERFELRTLQQVSAHRRMINS